MADNFDISLMFTLKIEGPFTNDPRDPGGPTNKGITLAEFQSFKPGATIEDLKNISDADVRTIYMNDYWLKCGADKLPSGVDFSVFDMAVNAGASRSVQILQREGLIPAAQQDGIVGPMTLAAVAKILPTDLVGYLASGQLRFYKSLTSLFAIYGKGWTNRTNLRYHMAYALAMTGSMGPICKAM